MLLRSTPEGAREFLVPTRIRSADSSAAPTFYALPQSPQQPKQLLMASGVTDKYFQIAKCFRDEAGRKDRQPEFTQVDIEMAFVDGAPPPVSSQSKEEQDWCIGGGQVRRTVESVIREIWLEAKGFDVLKQADAAADGFRVLTFHEAMSRYGSDKPDIRFGLEIVNLRSYLKSACNPSTSDGAKDNNATETVEIMALRIPKWSAEAAHSVANASTGKGKGKGRETVAPRTLSNADLKGLMRSGANADTPNKLERFKVPQPSSNVLARLLLQKSRHIRSYLEDSEVGGTSDDDDVERLAKGIEKALSVGRADLHSAVEEESETHLFVSSRRHPPVGGSTEMGELRLRLRDALVGKDLLRLPSEPHFIWVTEFPLLTYSDRDKSELSGGRWAATHHPFTAPSLESLPVLEQILDRLEAAAAGRSSAVLESAALTTFVSAEELESIKGQHYDLVLDGVELGGGSVRIHDARLQRRLLSLCLQLSDEEVARFDHLLMALASGCPPHAGIALGFDRLMALLATKDGEKTKRGIRDVIAFPKTAGGKDPLFNTPSPLDRNGDGDEYAEFGRDRTADQGRAYSRKI